ncbi:hypothetical protein POM88_021544 [Heracleum sosnowskyi]|uniref:Uncharacterized protein n=1 Tax=Heracleum sosnowskyi TaxID=360622 RepID=A0AAD8MSX7_9APIA|nr:hypothetical protein POM88_021544 [Heracleum sosnowskyi]
MDEENSESSSSRGSKKRKTRGPTLCKKLKEKMANQRLEVSVMDEENSESSSSRGSKKQKTRGPTLCKKLKEKMANQRLEGTIDFSKYGVPTGKMRKNFNSYIGSVVGLHVNINIGSWDVLNQGLKEMIWEDIKVMKIILKYS